MKRFKVVAAVGCMDALPRCSHQPQELMTVGGAIVVRAAAKRLR